LTGNRSLRQRMSLAAIVIAAGLLLATNAPPGLFRPAPAARTAVITATPIPLFEDDPERRRLGVLTYAAGWSLASDNMRFGGISAIHVENGNVIAVSDSGLVIRFPVPNGSGTVTGTIDPLPDGPGSPDIKQDRDSEAMTIAGDRAWIAFERRDAIWRYSTNDWRSDAHARPPAMVEWPNNSGSEGIVRLPDGRFLVFAESVREADGTSPVVAFEGDPALRSTPARRLGFRPPTGYRVTDAAWLSGDHILVLTRRFALWEGLSAKLVLAPLPAIEDGALIEGRVIAEFRAPAAVDNLEAISITREKGRTILWIASDDNFNPLQRTLLLKFAVDE